MNDEYIEKMLQQILDTMWVDPEILEELNEDQKRILFFKMRQEQLRKWRIREENETDETDRTAVKKSRSVKSVRFVLDNEGEPLLEFINDHAAHNYLSKAHKTTKGRLEPETVLNKNVFHEIVNNDKRSTLSSSKVAQKIALWEEKVFRDLQKVSLPNSDRVCNDLNDGFRYKQEEVMKRKDNNSNKSHNRTSRNKSNESILSTIRPKNKAALLEWYRTKEMPRQAGIVNNHFETWFHGYITQKEAENLLSDKSDGSFLVRLCENVWGYAITLKYLNTLKHYLIDASIDGHYYLIGSHQNHFTSLRSLINHFKSHSLSASDNEILKEPCPLSNNQFKSILLRSQNPFLIECQ